MALGSTQPLTEMSTRNLPGGKGHPARKADLTAICDPMVYKMREPRHLTNPWACTACYRDSFIFITLWHVDPLLGGDNEIGDCTAIVAMKRPASNREMVFSARSATEQFSSNRGKVFLCGPCRDIISRTT
jgi:hypothetical protein